MGNMDKGHLGDLNAYAQSILKHTVGVIRGSPGCRQEFSLRIPIVTCYIVSQDLQECNQATEQPSTWYH
jgi:hypothetical protein